MCLMRSKDSSNEGRLTSVLCSFSVAILEETNEVEEACSNGYPIGPFRRTNVAIRQDETFFRHPTGNEN